LTKHPKFSWLTFVRFSSDLAILQMNNTRLPKTACVQAKQLGARSVLEEGQRFMEKA